VFVSVDHVTEGAPAEVQSVVSYCLTKRAEEYAISRRSRALEGEGSEAGECQPPTDRDFQTSDLSAQREEPEQIKAVVIPKKSRPHTRV